MPPAALAAGGVLFHTTKPNPRTKHNLPIIFSSFEKTKRFFIFLLTNHPPTAIISHVLCTRTTYGGIAQLARAHGSYPWCPRFESRCRYHFFNFRLCLFILNGPVVKRSRHRPFTAVTRVRFPSGSPQTPRYKSSWEFPFGQNTVFAHCVIYELMIKLDSTCEKYIKYLVL